MDTHKLTFGEIWRTVPSSSHPQRANKMTLPRLTHFLYNGLFRGPYQVVFPLPLSSAELTKSHHMESGLNSATTHPF